MDAGGMGKVSQYSLAVARKHKNAQIVPICKVTSQMKEPSREALRIVRLLSLVTRHP